MKLKDVIAFCDRVKPNAFTEADKTQWVNDPDGRVSAPSR